MDENDDLDLKPDQWEALKALRAPVGVSPVGNPRVALERLLALGLVAMENQSPVITAKGRKALVRGSSRLWDVAA